MVWKLEKEINQIKYTNNISFPEARKIVKSKNQFQSKSYAQVATEAKHDHTCRLCHTLLEKLVKLTPENLPKFVDELKSSMSVSHQPQPSTSKQPVLQLKPTPPKEVHSRVNPPKQIQSPKSPVRRDNRSPISGLRQSPTRQRIQLEKTNSKNRFSVLEDEESME